MELVQSGPDRKRLTWICKILGHKHLRKNGDGTITYVSTQCFRCLNNVPINVVNSKNYV